MAKSKVQNMGLEARNWWKPQFPHLCLGICSSLARNTNEKRLQIVWLQVPILHFWVDHCDQRHIKNLHVESYIKICEFQFMHFQYFQVDEKIKSSRLPGIERCWSSWDWCQFHATRWTAAAEPLWPVPLLDWCRWFGKWVGPANLILTKAEISIVSDEI